MCRDFPEISLTPLSLRHLIVPTHRWYIERTVWLIAGLLLLVVTALAVLVDPRWGLAIIGVGLVSINVALTGFCPIGNVLRLLGFTPMLATRAPTRWNLHFMQTDRWYLERRIYLAVGINISVASVLVLVPSVWWLLFTGFVGTSMVWFAATGFCIMANSLYRLGAAPGAGTKPGAGYGCRERPVRPSLSLWRGRIRFSNSGSFK